MNPSQKPPINLRINRQAKGGVKKSGPVRLNETPSESAPAAKMADRLVVACRENVRFLNFHLSRYEKFLELPSMVDNALYLAYTIRVRNNSPYDALTIRRHLAASGIETSPAFSFVASPEDNYTGEALNRIREHTSQSAIDSRAFCLGCHQYLTILDLEHIITTFDSLFDAQGRAGDPVNDDSDSRGNR